MQESDEVEKRLSELVMLDLSDGQFRSEAEEIFELLSERDRQVSETFEALLEEIDDLIILADRLEKENIHPR